jgi:putative DNA primase/helicase
VNFAQFCAANGLIIRGGIRPTQGKQTIRAPTRCAPSEQKGWYRYSGTPDLDGKLRGVCGIWHGIDNGAQQWVQDECDDIKPLSKADFEAIAARAKQAADLERQKHQDAARRAVALLARSEPRSHAYLARKGFPELLAPCVADGAMLLVTMWKAGRVVNLQRINEAGEKRFLAGGECSGTAHVIGSQGVAVLCEGFATSLSVAAAIKASKMRAHTVCCFSADNLVKVAATYKDARVVADNDNLKTGTGEKAAKLTAFPYFMPPIDGQDFNDFARSAGLFAASQRIRELLLTK